MIHRRDPWHSLEAVELATLEWVDWFNNRRLVEPIGSIQPAKAEAGYYAVPEQLRHAGATRHDRVTQTKQRPIIRRLSAGVRWMRQILAEHSQKPRLTAGSEVMVRENGLRQIFARFWPFPVPGGAFPGSPGEFIPLKNSQS